MRASRLRRRRLLRYGSRDGDGRRLSSPLLSDWNASRRTRITSATWSPPRRLGLFAGSLRSGWCMSEIFLSLVIPCYNEQENVPTLLKRVEDSLAPIGKPFEVIIIDDGCTDETPKLLKEAIQTRSSLRVLRMACNSGQSAAFEVGFEAARGEIIATIDADLQND